MKDRSDYTFKKKINELLASRGMNQAQLAEIRGESRQLTQKALAQYKWEKSKMLVLFSQIFGQPVHYCFVDNDTGERMVFVDDNGGRHFVENIDPLLAKDNVTKAEIAEVAQCTAIHIYDRFAADFWYKDELIRICKYLGYTMTIVGDNLDQPPLYVFDDDDLAKPKKPKKKAEKKNEDEGEKKEPAEKKDEKTEEKNDVPAADVSEKAESPTKEEDADE